MILLWPSGEVLYLNPIDVRKSLHYCGDIPFQVGLIQEHVRPVIEAAALHAEVKKVHGEAQGGQ